MRFIFFIIFAGFTTGSLFAQQEKDRDRIISDRLVSLYNAEQYDSIFALFSDAMKKALPAEKTVQFFGDLHTRSGRITGHRFMEYKAGAASYKTTFEKAVFSLYIVTDSLLKINGLLLRPFTDKSFPTPERNAGILRLPFKGEWTVIWGGDTKALNYHVESPAQKNAFDMVITDQKGRSYKTTGETNEDYYAFGKELYAPCDGEVVLVVDGIKDNLPGTPNPVYVPGNTVVIKTPNNEFLLFAHFRHHSIKVAEGQKIKAGTLLGLCGNSGNSSEPHLHFHIQNAEDMNGATGIKCYFTHILVNGQLKEDYSPVKGDKVRNAN